MASPRDLEVLRTVGRFRMLTRPQLKRWIFPDVTEPVVTRSVARLAKIGYLGAERLGGNGVQVLWLTKKGRDFLASADLPVGDLFPASAPVAAKDFAHTIEIANAALWLRSLTPPPEELVPAWQLQRIFGGVLPAVPDLLAIWRHPLAALAVEIDLGTESVTTVLVPKLATLVSWLRVQFADAVAAVHVLVPGERRAKTLRDALLDASVMITVGILEEASRVNSAIQST